MNRLRVLRAGSPPAADGGPHHQRHVRLAVVHEVKFRGVRHELIERQQDEVGPIVHEDRAHAVHGGPGRHAHHRFFGQRGVEHAVRPEARLKAAGGAEHGEGIVDALTEHEDAGIVLQRQRQRFVDRLRVRDDAALGRVGFVVDERVDEPFIPRHSMASVGVHVTIQIVFSRVRAGERELERLGNFGGDARASMSSTVVAVEHATSRAEIRRTAAGDRRLPRPRAPPRRGNRSCCRRPLRHGREIGRPALR